MTEATPEAVQQTLQAYLAAATSTGALRGAAVEFTIDGQEWAPLVYDMGETGHLLAARATVYRDGWAIPTVVSELWVEVLPAEETWRGLWVHRPHVLFGAHALRTALRRTFADVLGERREPDDLDALPEPAPVRDWLAEVADATDPDAVRQIHRDAKAARAVDVPLETAIRRRLADLMQRPVKVGDKIAVPADPLAKSGAVLVGRVESRPAPTPETRPARGPKPPSPADLAKVIAPLPPRPKGGRRPQKQKPRGPRD